jgi:hypothetical protein
MPVEIINCSDYGSSIGLLAENVEVRVRGFTAQNCGVAGVQLKNSTGQLIGVKTQNCGVGISIQNTAKHEMAKESISEANISESLKATLIAELQKMLEAKNKETRTSSYNKFIAYASNHATVLGFAIEIARSIGLS